MSDFILTPLEATLTAHMSQKLYDEKDSSGKPKLDASLEPGQEYKVHAVYNLGEIEGQSPEDWFAEVCDRFGFKVVKGMFNGHMRFSLHSRMRTLVAQGKTEEEIQAALYNPDEDTYAYKPGEPVARSSSGEKYAEKFSKLSPEAKAEAVRNMSDEEKAELRAILESF